MKVLKNNPLVSILIPLYNSEKYIAQTIQSCVNQSWRNIEIIIVDDGSTDNSLRIVKEFEGNRVSVYQQKNQGACTARNKAFEICKGDFIQYLDADDLISPEKIENQLSCFDENINVISSCKWDRFYNNINKAAFPDRIIYKDYTNPIDWLIDTFEKKEMGQTSIWLTPRHLIEKAGKWNENLTINQDGEFFARVLLNAESIKFCKKAFVYYRSGDFSRISYTTNKRAQSLLYSYISIEEHILKVEDSIRTRHACYSNYLKFIYENYAADKELIEHAKARITHLGFKKLEPYGGKFFKLIANFLGFENALKLRKILK